MPDALPVHRVSVNGFWMDRTPVTNAEFERFVNATGYVTVAERQPDPKDFPGVPRDKVVPGSAVFQATSRTVSLDNLLQWWQYTAGASWRHPEGPGTGIQDRLDHPVVHIAFEDAWAYAQWVGKRLPTEAEFEFAARPHPNDTAMFNALPHVEVHVVLGRPGTGHRVAHRGRERAHVGRRVVLAAPYFIIAAMAAAETDCIAALPSRMADLCVRLLPLKRVRAMFPLPRINAVMIWHQRTRTRVLILSGHRP